MGERRAKGSHILMDYIDYASPGEQEGLLVLDLIRDCVRKCGIREVHSHVEDFDGNQSPPGFAAVVLIDESHVSAHCYSESGLLAVDVFTCGRHDSKELADLIHDSLVSIIPDLRLLRRDVVNRFLENGD
tara:strand:+ start:160 stop:549 length:390 start_codon:yes stop_codon:yes gene_type:complete